MINRKTTVVLDGTTKADYDQLCEVLAAESPESQGWHIDRDPILHRVIASKTEEFVLPE